MSEVTGLAYFLNSVSSCPDSLQVLTPCNRELNEARYPSPLQVLYAARWFWDSHTTPPLVNLSLLDQSCMTSAMATLGLAWYH